MKAKSETLTLEKLQEMVNGIETKSKKVDYRRKSEKNKSIQEGEKQIMEIITPKVILKRPKETKEVPKDVIEAPKEIMPVPIKPVEPRKVELPAPPTRHVIRSEAEDPKLVDATDEVTCI